METLTENSNTTLAEVPAKNKMAMQLAKKLLKLNPGIGEKSLAIVESLVDFGVSPVMASMMLEAVYSPASLTGRGNGSRLKWVSDMIKNHYAHRLEKIQNNVTAFRTFLAELDDITELRETCVGEGISLSYEQAFLMASVGASAESVVYAVTSLMADRRISLAQARRVTLISAQAVVDGKFANLESSISFFEAQYE